MTRKDEDKKRDDPYVLKDIFVEMEMDLVRSFHRNLVKHRLEEQEAGFSWEMWQVAMLRNIEQYRKENRQIINGYRPAVKDAVENVLNYRYEQGRKNVEKMAKAAKVEPSTGQIDLDKGSFSFPQNERNTALPGQTPPQETQFFGVNGKKLKVLIDSVTSDMEDVSNAIYRKMDDVYRQTIFKAEMQLSTGAISLYQAIDKATEEFLAKGLDCIVYKGGRHVNVATYAEMALRTAYQRAGFLGEGAKRDEYGNHLIVVSTHPNCCNLCFPWQGQILIDDVFSHPSDEYMEQYKSKYKLLSSAIKAGLMHPNCRHALATWFEGISRLPKIYDEEEAKKNYAAEQKQRAMENAIRKAKRQKAGATDEDNKKDAVAKLRALRSELKRHLEKNPQLKRNPYREKTERVLVKESMDDGLKIPKFSSNSNSVKANPNNHSEKIVNEYFGLMKIKTSDKGLIDYVKRDMKMMPLKDLDFLKKLKVSIELSHTNSKYRSIMGLNKILIDYKEGKAEGSFAHEFAHFVSNCTELYKSDEFLDVLQNALKGASLASKKIADTEYIYVKSDKFVKDYQGRTYITVKEYQSRKDGIIELSELREYVSVGYQTYITNPSLLYEKDRMLYDYFEKVGLVNERKK